MEDLYALNLLMARIQMGYTLAFHIIFASLGVGFPVLLVIAEGLHLKTGKKDYLILAKRWSKVFSVLFGVGAVSGTVLSFELGLLWPKFMEFFGPVVGLAFSLEGFAFFVEAIFLGIYLYGWDKLPKKIHWLCGFPIALSGALSAWFVTTVNSWMNTPQGFSMHQGKVTSIEPLKVIFNPGTWTQTTHMLLSCYMVTGFTVASYYAWNFLKKKKHINYFKNAFELSLLMAILITPLQIFVGDFAARLVAKTQPVKLAAMEGQFETVYGAPLRIGGLPNEKKQTTPFAIEIQKGLSLLAYHNPNAKVLGLKAFPKSEWPPVLPVHLFFQVMVGLGIYLLMISLYAGYHLYQKKEFPKNQPFLWGVLFSGAAALLAMEAGWMVTELGRQPWVVHQVMKTKDAVTLVQETPWSLTIVFLIYTALSMGLVFILLKLSKIPLESK